MIKGLPEETKRACQRKQLEHTELETEFQRLSLTLDALDDKATRAWNTNERWMIQKERERIIGQIEIIQAKLYGLEDWLIDNECPSWEQLS